MAADVGDEYRNLVERPQSVVGATLVALGSERPSFEAATSLDYGVERHRFASGAHAVSREDADRLCEVITKAGTDAHFWSDYVGRGTAAGRRLIDTARTLGSAGEEPRGTEELLEGFAAFADAAKGMAPFVLATPVVRPVLESFAAESLEGRPAEALGRLRRAWQEPEAVREMRNGYRIAVEVLNDDAAAGVFRTTSPLIAVRRVEQELPGLYGLIREHIDEYGWLRAQRYGLLPLSPKELVDRIQGVVLRWPVEAIQELARPQAAPDLHEVLGSSPPEPLAELVTALHAMTTQRAFRVDALLQAECLARPFFADIAGALGCTVEQVLFSSVEEIVAGLSTHKALPTEDIDHRIHDGFTVRRAVGGLEVVPSRNGGGGAGGPTLLTGMTGCRGRAVGTVKVILDAAELDRLEIGDVLVTAASTTDMMGGGTVFPTRTGGPPALEKAAAVVADEGGLLSHAAIVCRERGIPCVIGTESATTALRDGQVVEVDATQPTGRVIPYV